MKKIIAVIILVNSICYSQDNIKIYNWNTIVNAKIIESKEDLINKKYSDLNLLLTNHPQLNQRELKLLKSLLKFDSYSMDIIKEKRQILMQIEFQNETVLFLIHLEQATLFDLRPNKFNFIRILNNKKFQNFITTYLNKNI